MTAPWRRSAICPISSPTRSSTPWCGSTRAFSTSPRAASRTPPGSPRRTRASGGRSSRRTAWRSARPSARFGRRSITSTGWSRAGMRPPSKASSTASAASGMACGEDPRHARGAPAPSRRRPVKGRGTHELVVTIDGPAGAGKSATARALAQRLGYRLVDTGALYRALAWAVSASGVDPEDAERPRRGPRADPGRARGRPRARRWARRQRRDPDARDQPPHVAVDGAGAGAGEDDAAAARAGRRRRGDPGGTGYRHRGVAATPR